MSRTSELQAATGKPQSRCRGRGPPRRRCNHSSPVEFCVRRGTAADLSNEVAAFWRSGAQVTEMAWVSVGATVRAGVTWDSVSVGPATHILKGPVRSRAHP